jgi:hypothetical protein
MNESSSSPYDLQQLVESLVEQRLDDAGRARLGELVRSNGAARREYCRRMALHKLLEFKHARSIPVTIPIHRSGTRRLSLLAATMLIGAIFYGTIVAVLWTIQPRERDSDSSVAVIHHAKDVKWSPHAEAKAEDDRIRQDESLTIDSGAVELELKSGAELVVEGPAKWRVEGENRIHLYSGKLYAHVPKAAVGFTVATTSAEIVDFGTEFGVAAEASGATHVEVFNGEIGIASRSIGGRYVDVQKMRAGDVRQINADGVISKATPQPKGFMAFSGKIAQQKSSSSLSGTFDPAAWTTKAPTQVKNARAVIEPKMVRLENRGYVVSRDQYVPSIERPLTITGKFYTASQRDWLAIWTRSSGEPTDRVGEAADGVKCLVGLQSDDLVGILAGGDKLKAREISKEGKLKATAGMLLEFSVVDRGDQVTLTVWQVSNPANRATTTAQITDQGTEHHHVVLYNCEQEGANSNLLYLVDLHVDQRTRSKSESSETK